MATLAFMFHSNRSIPKPRSSRKVSPWTNIPTLKPLTRGLRTDWVPKADKAPNIIKARCAKSNRRNRIIHVDKRISGFQLPRSLHPSITKRSHANPQTTYYTKPIQDCAPRISHLSICFLERVDEAILGELWEPMWINIANRISKFGTLFVEMKNALPRSK